MVRPCIYEGEAAIRAMLLEHCAELVKEKQEVRIAWRRSMPIPAICLLRGYEPPGDGEYADTLGVYPGGEVVCIISPSQVTYFEVLATKKMTGDTFMSEMRQMEKAGGLEK